MKRFSFRLQTVLDMREKFLEQKRLEMAKVVSILNEQIQALDNLKSRKEMINGGLESIYSGEKELDISEITGYKNFLGKIGVDIKNQENTIENTKSVLAFKQQEVSDALKAVKVLETLKEKQEKKFYQHYDYVQSKEIDDIASTRYRRVVA